MRAPPVRTQAAARVRVWAVRARHWFDRVRAKAERRLPVLTELTERLLSANLLDAASRLAAQVFLTSVPLLFAFGAFAPTSVRDQMLSSIRSLFGLSGSSEQQLRMALGTGPEASSGGEELRQTTGAIGALMALISATSCSRAVARVCERAWRLPKYGARVGAWRWLLWVASWGVILLFQGPLRDGFGEGLWLGLPLTFAAGVLVWWWTQRLLLGARVAWLPLLPGAVLAGVALSALELTARLYIPRALNRALQSYGSMGLVLTMLSWLIAVCAALAASLTSGAVIAQGPPLNAYLYPGTRPEPPAEPDAPSEPDAPAGPDPPSGPEAKTDPDSSPPPADPPPGGPDDHRPTP
jgi:membrane protein